MYTIKAYVDSKEYTIHDARVKALTVGGNPYFEIGDNINGSATFKVFPTHPYYDNGNSWTYSHLRVYNGIIVGYWN